MARISWHMWFLMVANSQAACEAGLPDAAVLWRWEQTLPYTGTQHILLHAHVLKKAHMPCAHLYH